MDIQIQPSKYVQKVQMSKLINANYTSAIWLHTYVYLLNVSRERHCFWIIINRRIIRQHSNYINQFDNVCHNNYNFSIVQISTLKKMLWMINRYANDKSCHIIGRIYNFHGSDWQEPANPSQTKAYLLLLSWLQMVSRGQDQVMDECPSSKLHQSCNV